MAHPLAFQMLIPMQIALNHLISMSPMPCQLQLQLILLLSVSSLPFQCGPE